MRSCSVNRAGTMVTQQIPISDEDGNLLIEHFWSSMAVKSTSDCVYGDPPPDHRYPEEARNHIIGEEVFAAGAYLSHDPVQRGSLRGQDIAKLLLLTIILIGILAATLSTLDMTGGTDWSPYRTDWAQWLLPPRG